MGRELQKKKNRSSLNKVRRKPKSKKRVFGNDTIARNWDKSLTLSQNYKKLGLTAGLNKPTGGQEKTIATLNEKKATTTRDKFAITSTLPTSIGISEARVERDSETGGISRVIGENTPAQQPNPLNDPLNDIEDEDESPNEMVPDHEGRQTEVIRELEAQAAQGERRRPRHQSDQEKQWIETLVAKHGDDYDKMFMDRKLNPMQQTANQLKKKILAWRRANASAMIQSQHLRTSSPSEVSASDVLKEVCTTSRTPVMTPEKADSYAATSQKEDIASA